MPAKAPPSTAANAAARTARGRRAAPVSAGGRGSLEGVDAMGAAQAAVGVTAKSLVSVEV